MQREREPDRRYRAQPADGNHFVDEGHAGTGEQGQVYGLVQFARQPDQERPCLRLELPLTASASASSP